MFILHHLKEHRQGNDGSNVRPLCYTLTITTTKGKLMTKDEIIALLHERANNCAIVRDNYTMTDDCFSHSRHWEIQRLTLLDIIAYIEHNSN